MLEVGQAFDAKILSNTLREIGDKEAVSLTVRSPDGDEGEVLIWFGKTEKGMRFAYAQLDKCGFKAMTEPLYDLADNEALLRGNIVPVIVDEWNGRIQIKVDMQGKPSKKKIAEVQEHLRNCIRADDDGTHREPETKEDIPF